MSPQEEELLTLAAIHRLGEATAHDIATELGVMSIRHTLQRLEHAGRVVKQRLTRGNGNVWVFALAPRTQAALALHTQAAPRAVAPS